VAACGYGVWLATVLLAALSAVILVVPEKEDEQEEAKAAAAVVVVVDVLVHEASNSIVWPTKGRPVWVVADVLAPELLLLVLLVLVLVMLRL